MPKLTLTNVKLLDGTIGDHSVESEEPGVVDAEGRLTLLPSVIDPHVHFRTPGHEHKEDWVTAGRGAGLSGVTTVFDMPNNSPPCTTKEALRRKKEIIDGQLKEAGIPLRYHLYFGADANHLEELGQVKDEIIGLKIYMGSSTGGLTMDSTSALDNAFRLAGQENVLIAVHAEDEAILQKNLQLYQGEKDASTHSKVRSPDAAVKATKEAIALAEKYGTRLVICHVSTGEEIELIKEAKKRGVLVYCEVCTHHLFLSTEDYSHLNTLGQVNPPLRSKKDQQALWRAIDEGVVDFFATDHAPHTLEEKMMPYGQAPSGIPGVETLLPLLLNAYNEGKLTLEKIVQLTRVNIEQIYELERTQDFVLVDLDMVKEVKIADLKTKCGWSPYAGRHLKGWPVYTILKGKAYHC